MEVFTLQVLPLSTGKRLRKWFGSTNCCPASVGKGRLASSHSTRNSLDNIPKAQPLHFPGRLLRVGCDKKTAGDYMLARDLWNIQARFLQNKYALCWVTAWTGFNLFPIFKIQEPRARFSKKVIISDPKGYPINPLVHHHVPKMVSRGILNTLWVESLAVHIVDESSFPHGVTVSKLIRFNTSPYIPHFM